jgi:hypothetical protein
MQGTIEFYEVSSSNICKVSVTEEEHADKDWRHIKRMGKLQDTTLLALK